jgi:hypothetical protein
VWKTPGTLDVQDQMAELTDHLKKCIAMLSTVLAALDENTASHSDPAQSHAGSRGDMTGGSRG